MVKVRLILKMIVSVTLQQELCFDLSVFLCSCISTVHFCHLLYHRIVYMRPCKVQNGMIFKNELW